MKRLKILCIMLLAFAGNLAAGPVVSAGSGDWNNPSTWSGGIIPGAGDIVTIANGHTVSVTANASCAAITIGSAPFTQSSVLTFNAGISLTVSGNITITPPTSGITDNTLDVNAGIVSCSNIITSNSLNDNRRCVVTIGTGTLRCSGSCIMGNNSTRNKLIFSGAGVLQVAGNSNAINNAQFTSAAGTVEYNGNAAQSVLPLHYYSLSCSGSSSKLLTGNTVVAGNLLIAGTALLDVSATHNFHLSVGGNWTVTSTNAYAFLARKGTVTFNGTAGVQTLSTVLPKESFYNLIINNAAGNSGADIEFTKSCEVLQAYTHTNGQLDLKGNKLSVISENRLGVFTSCNLSGGSIISSVNGAQVSFTDTYDSTFVNFTGTSIGDNTRPVRLSINTGRINLQNLRLYGTGSFTKKHTLDDISAKGGNKFYGNVSFTVGNTGGSWYLSAGNGALPDSFFAKVNFTSFAGNINSRFTMGANTTGNYYADNVNMYVRSAGSITIGYSSGAANGTASTNYFNKAVDIWLSGSGNIIFSEGQSLLPSTTTFNGQLRIGSAAGSTGSVYIGKNTSGSSVQITNAGQIASGFLYGTNTIYLYNVVQTGALAQMIINTFSPSSRIIVGGTNGGCTWGGPVTFIASVLDLSYSTFNGSINTFNLKNSTAPQNCTGGNRFGNGTVNLFNNYGTSNWYMAATAADDYDGDVHYRAYSTGAIYPAYNTNCTYATGIAVQPSSDSISFAAGPNGRVTFDGNTSGFFINNSLKTVTFKRLTANKPGTILSLYSHIFVSAGGDLTLTAGRIVTGTTGMIILQDETCTITNITAASTSYIDGPMRMDVSTTAPLTLHFPVGRDFESRPVDLTVQHSSNTSYSYTTEMVLSDANALGWTNPASVYTTSTRRWWNITRTVTSNGAAAPTTDLVTSPLPIVSLYYGLNDRANIPANLTICKNTHAALTTWVNIGAGGATNGIGKVTSTSAPTQFNSFSRFTLGYYGIPPAPVAHDSSRCGSGVATIRATPVYGEFIDWYATATGGTALATNTELFNTPVISSTTAYYAQARNTVGYVSATRTAITAIINNAPIVSSFTPTTGESGTTVVINGTDFINNVSAVTFGGVAAASFTVNSPTQITAVVNTGASGSVAVTNDCGTGSKTGFIYNPLTVWTGAVNTSWINPGNWDDGVPTLLHSAIIPNVANQPLISSNQTIKSITVQAGATLDIAVGNSLNIRDSVTNNGDVIGGGVITLSGTASQIIKGTGNYNNLSVNNTNGAVILNGTGNMVNITGRYIPTAGVLTTNNNLTIKSTATSNGTIAQGPAAGNYISGKVILERYIPAKRSWRLINFPITNTAAPDINTALQEGAGGNASSNPNPGYGTHITGGSVANGFDQNSSNNPSVKEWAGGAWQGIASTNTPIDNQFPYFVFVRGSRANNLAAGTAATPDNTTLRVMANVKQGNQSISIGGTGWQLTGNPFPSVINLDAVAAGNSSKINRNFVYWDPKLGGSNNVGGFITASYNGAGYDFTPSPVSSLSEYAQPFAGFYVEAIAAGTITIPESSKCNCGNGDVFRAMPHNSGKLHINLRSVNTDGSNPVVDGTMVSFNNRYSNNKDSYDVSKLPNMLSENIAVTSNENRLSIERRKAIADNDTIYLHISNMRVRNYQFEIIPENFDTTLQAYLEDSYTAERKPINLSSGGTFAFSIINNPAVYAPNRFRIIFEKERMAVMAKQPQKKNNLTLSKGNIKLLQNPVVNNTLQLAMLQQPAGSYAVLITDNAGKEMARQQFYHDGNSGIKKITIPRSLPNTTLQVTVKNHAGSSTSFTAIAQ